MEIPLSSEQVQMLNSGDDALQVHVLPPCTIAESKNRVEFRSFAECSPVSNSGIRHVERGGPFMQKTIRFLSLLTLWGQFSLSYGQQATPPEPWTGSAAAGIALTGGNSDTSNYSLSLDLQWDPETPHLVKSSVSISEETRTMRLPLIACELPSAMNTR